VPYVNLDGVRLHYQQSGHGCDVVLIHAVTSNLAVWLFSGIVERLSTEFRVTAYDLRGHGTSDVTPAGYTSADMADDLHRLHAALGLGPAFLVGHSFGAVVALHAAVLYPQSVAGLVLSDPYFPGLGHLEPNLGESEVWQDLRDVFHCAGVEIGGSVNFANLFYLVRDLTPEQLETVKHEMGAAGARWLAQLPRLAETTCGADVFAVAGLTEDRIRSVRQPVVALYNEHTPLQATWRWLREHLPHSTIEIVPGAKHVAVLQNPEVFAGLVQKHLSALARG
jgi:pimeloyl-ACP methyl ester carboxylesterase